MLKKHQIRFPLKYLSYDFLDIEGASMNTAYLFIYMGFVKSVCPRFCCQD